MKLNLTRSLFNPGRLSLLPFDGERVSKTRKKEREEFNGIWLVLEPSSWFQSMLLGAVVYNIVGCCWLRYTVIR